MFANFYLCSFYPGFIFHLFEFLSNFYAISTRYRPFFMHADSTHVTGGKLKSHIFTAYDIKGYCHYIMRSFVYIMFVNSWFELVLSQCYCEHQP